MKIVNVEYTDYLIIFSIYFRKCHKEFFFYGEDLVIFFLLLILR